MLVCFLLYSIKSARLTSFKVFANSKYFLYTSGYFFSNVLGLAPLIHVLAAAGSPSVNFSL